MLDRFRSNEYNKNNFPASGGEKQQVDTLFLKQINEWRVSLSNELYRRGGRYQSLEVLNDVVQEFINQIVFLRICEDKNLPLYQLKFAEMVTITRLRRLCCVNILSPHAKMNAV